MTIRTPVWDAVFAYVFARDQHEACAYGPVDERANTLPRARYAASVADTAVEALKAIDTEGWDATTPDPATVERVTAQGVTARGGG